MVNLFIRLSGKWSLKITICHLWPFQRHSILSHKTISFIIMVVDTTSTSVIPATAQPHVFISVCFSYKCHFTSLAFFNTAIILCQIAHDISCCYLTGLAINSIILFLFCKKSSTICLEGKSMTPRRRNTHLLLNHSVGPLKGYLG